MVSCFELGEFIKKGAFSISIMHKYYNWSAQAKRWLLKHLGLLLYIAGLLLTLAGIGDEGLSVSVSSTSYAIGFLPTIFIYILFACR